MSRFRHAGLAALFLLAATGTGCQRGEKSCRYYSIVLEKSESTEDRRHALDEIKRMNSKDQLKCDDDAVFSRLGKTMDNNKFRPTVVETVENLGRAGGKLRERAEKLLVSGLSRADAAGQIATVFRSWRLESQEGKDPWAPSKATTEALAAAIKRISGNQAGAGQARAQLVEALFLAVTDPKERAQYEDLLIELADTDPAQQSVDVNIKAMQYLAEMHSKNEKAFAAYIHGLYNHDAARAETYMAARLAVATFPREKIAEKMLKILDNKDTEMPVWAKQAGLFDWEWQQGPKAMQLLIDTHVQSSAAALVSHLDKPVKAADTDSPNTFKAINKNLPWSAYVVSRFQLSTWALASLGAGLDPVAADIGKLSKTNYALEQRSHPLLGLAISGSNKAWATVLDVFTAIPSGERGEFVQAAVYAVDTQNLDEFKAKIAGEKTEPAATAVKDPTVVNALKVVEECKKVEDAATGNKGEALAGCYNGFLASGDAIAKTKAAIGLVHLAARGTNVTKFLIDGLEKASPAQDGITLRQVLLAGIRNVAKPEDFSALYRVQQLQVQDFPASQVWFWDLDVILNQLYPEAEKAGFTGGKQASGASSVVAPGEKPAEKAGDKKGAPAAAPAAGAAPAAAAAPAPAAAPSK